MISLTITGWLRDAGDPIGRHGRSRVRGCRFHTCAGDLYLVPVFYRDSAATQGGAAVKAITTKSHAGLTCLCAFASCILTIRVGVAQAGQLNQFPIAIVTTSAIDSHVGMELPTSKPPGISDRTIFAIEKPRSSPAGTYWGYHAFTESGSTNTDEILVVVGPTGGQTVIVEGTTMLSDGSGESITSIDGKYGLNDNGCYAILADSSTDSDDVIAKGCEGSPLSVIARRNEVVPNLGGSITYIGFAREPQIDNTGQVWFGFDTSEGSTNRSIFVATDNTDAVRVFQEGVSNFADLFSTTRVLESPDIEFSSQGRGGLRVSGDGMHTLLRGDFQGDTATDDFLAFDGAVVVQEGAPVAGFAENTAANSPLGSYLGATNSYFARGINTDGTAWAMRDGSLLAKSGDVAADSTGEVFSGNFASFTPGLNGDYAIAGLTDLFGEFALFYDDGNTRRPIARTGDDVDLNADGQITLADAQIQGFNNDGAVILPGNMLVANVSLCTAPCATTPDFLGSALVAFDLTPEGNGGDPNLIVTKTAELIFDADQSGIPFAQDVIGYEVMITNTGGDLNQPFSFLDITDLNTILIPTATVTSKGTILVGRNRGDLRVDVLINSLAGGETVTINYRVRVNRTIDSDIICNQGEIIGLSDQILSDDPDTPEADDPTCLPAGPGSSGNGGANGNPNPSNPLCKGRPVTIEGTNGDDVIMGTPDADVIHGFRGNDMIFGMGGDDTICGGIGQDYIEGGAGNDNICGQSGRDTLHGGDGDDRIRGQRGGDQLFGEAGNDSLAGGAANDGLSGGPGNDNLLGGSGEDDLEGGSDIDALSGDSGDDFLRGGDGDDRLYGNFGNDELHGGDGDDRILGGVGDDFADGGNGNDRIVGGAGDDILLGNLGADVLRGGFGRDNILGGPDQIGDPALDNDTVIGGPEDDVLDGGIGDDQIRGNQGDDDMDGGDGTDECRGGLGTDQATNCETTQSVP